MLGFCVNHLSDTTLLICSSPFSKEHVPTTITNASSGALYRPSYTCLGQDSKQMYLWKSIERHATYYMLFIIGYSQEGLQVLKDCQIFCKDLYFKDSSTWIAMDDNPFTAVSLQNLLMR
jgi:hypothetical protein